MIHEAFTKAEIAIRYYSIVVPGRTFTNEQARKRFLLDKNVDLKIIRQIIDVIYSEQKRLLKAINKTLEV